MSNVLDPILTQISKLWERVDVMPTMRWGTVVAASPLAVQLDGDAVQLPFPPASVISPLREGARVLCVEQNRRVTVVSANVALRGTSAQRDAVFGVPATDAQRVILANIVPTWFNTEKGYHEGYYATTGLSGLTARGLVAGTPSGWFPLPGSLLTATRIHVNSFQNMPSGGTVGADLGSGFLVNIGGFTVASTNGIVVPVPGYYSVSGAVYYSGGGAMAYVMVLIHQSNGAGGWTELLSSRVYGPAADVQPAVSDDGIALKSGVVVTLSGSTAAAHNMYGDGTTRRTFLTLTYQGPLVVNG